MSRSAFSSPFTESSNPSSSILFAVRTEHKAGHCLHSFVEALENRRQESATCFLLLLSPAGIGHIPTHTGQPIGTRWPSCCQDPDSRTSVLLSSPRSPVSPSCSTAPITLKKLLPPPNLWQQIPSDTSCLMTLTTLKTWSENPGSNHWITSLLCPDMPSGRALTPKNGVKIRNGF